MQPCAFPAPLQPGDALWVTLPSGALGDRAPLAAGLAQWQARGYRLLGLDCLPQAWGYLAGSDAARRHHLYQGFTHPECRGILCGRGGFGSARLLEDWHWPAVPPKWLVGFSDVTALLWSYARQGMGAVHGPVLTTLAQEPQWSQERLFDCVEGRSLAALEGQPWGGGKAEGVLLPANLTVATHLLGTAWAPDLGGVILALEDVGEAPYRLDRLLTHWRMAGWLDGVAGIALGRFSRCHPPAGYNSFSVAEVLLERLGDLGIPLVADLPFGHGGANAALPVGQPVILDGDRGCLSWPETSLF